MKPIRIGIDLDGVLRDFIPELSNFYKRYFPGKQIFDSNSYKLENRYEIGKDIYKFVDDNSYRIFSAAPMIEKAAELIENISSIGADIVIITTPWNKKAMYANVDWLSRYSIPAKELYQTRDKTNVDCDIYIDDKSDVIISYENLWRKAVETSQKFIIVYDQAWNRESFEFAVRSFDHDQTFSYIKSFISIIKQ